VLQNPLQQIPCSKTLASKPCAARIFEFSGGQDGWVGRPDGSLGEQLSGGQGRLGGPSAGAR